MMPFCAPQFPQACLLILLRPAHGCSHADDSSYTVCDLNCTDSGSVLVPPFALSWDQDSILPHMLSRTLLNACHPLVGSHCWLPSSTLSSTAGWTVGLGSLGIQLHSPLLEQHVQCLWVLTFDREYGNCDPGSTWVTCALRTWSPSLPTRRSRPWELRVHGVCLRF